MGMGCFDDSTAVAQRPVRWYRLGKTTRIVHGLSRRPGCTYPKRRGGMVKPGHVLCWMVAGVAAATLSCSAADYPARPVDLVVAGNPGGGLDLVARELDTALHEAKLFTQPFVIKN